MLRVVVVSGTRTSVRRGVVSAYLDKVKPDRVIVGCAAGVDAEAREWCQANGVDPIEAKALWRARGRRAGMRRNAILAELARLYAMAGHDVTYVAVPGPTSVGTHDAVERFEAAGLTGEEL